jgi:predicted acetyltransferase
MKSYASPFLSAPSVAVRRSFLAAQEEFAEVGEPGYPGGGLLLGEFLPLTRGWHTQEGFARFVAWVHARAEVPPSDGLVPTTDLWLVTPEHDYLGRISIRHRLNRRLMADGGNIGYDIRPSARGRGLATLMLGAALPRVAGLGIDPALLTVLPENKASRCVIEQNGGIRDDGTRSPEVSAVPTHLLRYWLPTRPALE